MPLYAIIRLRGSSGVSSDVEHTLKLLRLHKIYHATLYPSDLPGLEGMLRRAKDWITWGEISREALEELLRSRGRIPGNKPLSDEYVEKTLGLKGIKELADKIYGGEIILHKVEDRIKPVFRLHPPKGGFKRSKRRSFQDGGELGYRGEAINDLILRML